VGRRTRQPASGVTLSLQSQAAPEASSPAHAEAQQLRGPLQELMPVQARLHRPPRHAIAPAHELVPLHVISVSPASAVIGEAQEDVPEQRTVQLLPPQVMLPPHALTPVQPIVQEVAALQSTPEGHRDGPEQETLHGIPAGQTTRSLQLVHSIVQVPPLQVPPAATQVSPQGTTAAASRGSSPGEAASPFGVGVDPSRFPFPPSAGSAKATSGIEEQDETATSTRDAATMTLTTRPPERSTSTVYVLPGSREPPIRTLPRVARRRRLPSLDSHSCLRRTLFP
jgi:hypothetical protein